MQRSILIRQKKGGVGKSALAVALENALTAAGVTMRLVDADTPEDDAAGGASLSGVFGERVHRFTINPAAWAVEEDPNALRLHWFPLCEAIMQGGALVDFGANTNTAFDAALREGGWGEDFAAAGVPLSVVIPVTTNPEALKGGIQGIAATREILPSAQIVVALVGKEKPFSAFAGNPLFAPLLAERDRGVAFIDIPRCISTLWQPIELAGIDFATAIRAALADPDGFGQRIGLSRQEVRLGVSKLASWYEHVGKELAAVGLVPAAAKSKAKAN